MGSSVHPRLLANQLVVREMLRQRQMNLDGFPRYDHALSGALSRCDDLEADEVTKAEVRALIVAMRSVERA